MQNATKAPKIHIPTSRTRKFLKANSLNFKNIRNTKKQKNEQKKNTSFLIFLIVRIKFEKFQKGAIKMQMLRIFKLCNIKKLSGHKKSCGSDS